MNFSPVFLRTILLGVFLFGGVLFVNSCDILNPPKTSTGRSVFGVDANNVLIRFGATSPDVVNRTVTISGLQSGERIVGIDFRPLDKGLYALGSSNRLYKIDTTSGAATVLGTSAFTPALSGSTAEFGFDFNPTVDRIRSHAVSGQNLRLNPLTGGVAATDSVLAFALTDANTGKKPALVGTAYTNSVSGATTTLLYAIDSGLDILVKLSSPNNGRIETIGGLGAGTSEYVGFDIAADSGILYASLTTAQGASGFYTVNATTGVATLVGTIKHSSSLVGIAIAQ